MAEALHRSNASSLRQGRTVDWETPQEAVEIDKLLVAFHALSEPLRIATVELLRSRELCVGELCDALEVAQSKISFHLKVLRQADLVLGRQDGRWVYYRLNVPQFARIEQYLAELRCFSPMVPPSTNGNRFRTRPE